MTPWERAGQFVGFAACVLGVGVWLGFTVGVAVKLARVINGW